MKAKERPGPVTIPAPPGDGGHAEAHAVRAGAFAWEDWFRQATTAQQAEALALAQRQGYLHAHQLPAPTAEVTSAPALPPGDGLDRLRNLLNGKIDALPRIALCAAEQADPSLTHVQQRASARALASPDIALFRARPGQAAAVLADVIIQASRLGQRILLLTQQLVSLDQVLQRLHGRDAILPVRFLDPGETIPQLAPAVRAYTLDAQRQLFQTNTLAKAQAGRAQTEERCRRRHDEAPLWPQLAQLAERHSVLEEKRQSLTQRYDDTPAEVRDEAAALARVDKATSSGQFALQLGELMHDFSRQAAAIDCNERQLEARQANLRADLDRWQAEKAVLQPMVEARQQGRWWSGAWWRGMFAKDLAGRAARLNNQHTDLQASLAAAATELQQCADQRRQAEAKIAADREALIAAESERRRQALAAHIAEIESEQGPIRSDWQALVGKLDQEHHPSAPAPVAVAEAQARWRATKQHDEADCLFARQWASFVQESAPNFVAQLPRYASLLAGTTVALSKNADFRTFADRPFDLVIIDDADRLLENDLLRLARKGRRCLLVGNAQCHQGRPSSFDKLWQALHIDPSTRLAYRWCKEGERWCCHLRPVAAHDRRFLETERLADFPEIELRILSLPKARPQLAQVVFPATMTLGQAKGFIHRELQEVAIQPAGRSAWLEDRGGDWTLHLGSPAASELMAIDLEPGVREWACARGLTHRLEIDKSIWQFAQAEDWIGRNLNLRDLGRTFELT